MASASFSLANTANSEANLGTSSQRVAEGTSAPGVGDLEVRIDLTKSWTELEIREAFETIWRFIVSPSSTSIPL